MPSVGLCMRTVRAYSKYGSNVRITPIYSLLPNKPYGAPAPTFPAPSPSSTICEESMNHT